MSISDVMALFGLCLGGVSAGYNVGRDSNKTQK